MSAFYGRYYVCYIINKKMYVWGVDWMNVLLDNDECLYVTV